MGAEWAALGWNDRDVGLGGRGTVDGAASHRPLEQVQFAHRLAEGHIHRVDLFDGGEQRRFALAEQRGYSALLIQLLQDLAHRVHLVLYRPRAPRLRRILDFFAAGFPRLVRAQWRAMSIAALLFFLPLIGSIVLLQVRPELVHTIFDPGQLAQFENMYDPASSAERIGREGGTDLNKFGV